MKAGVRPVEDGTVAHAGAMCPDGIEKKWTEVCSSDGPNGEELTRLRLVKGHWETESLGPCRFVPLIGADGYAGAEAG